MALLGVMASAQRAGAIFSTANVDRCNEMTPPQGAIGRGTTMALLGVMASAQRAGAIFSTANVDRRNEMTPPQGAMR